MKQEPLPWYVSVVFAMCLGAIVFGFIVDSARGDNPSQGDYGPAWTSPLVAFDAAVAVKAEPKPASRIVGHDEIVAVLAGLGNSDAEIQAALKLCQRESGFDASAISPGGGCRGLFQLSRGMTEGQPWTTRHGIPRGRMCTSKPAMGVGLPRSRTVIREDTTDASLRR